MNLVDEVVSQTAEVFQQPLAELCGRSRKRPIVEARQAAMWTIRQRYPSLSLYTIGMALVGGTTPRSCTPWRPSKRACITMRAIAGTWSSC